MPAKFSYEKAIIEIEEIIEEIESDTLDVDELADKIKKVSGLIKSCKKKLTETRSEVDQLLTDLDKDE